MDIRACLYEPEMLESLRSILQIHMKTTEEHKSLEFSDVFNNIIIPIPNGQYFENMDFGWYTLLELAY